MDSPKLAYDLAAIKQATGICDTQLRTDIRNGRLRVFYVGRKPFARPANLEAYLESFPDTAPHRRAGEVAPGQRKKAAASSKTGASR